MMVVPASDVRVLEMSVEEGIRMVVTAGMIAEKDLDALKAIQRSRTRSADKNRKPGGGETSGKAKGA
jgi:uncharacterized membrane protein